MQEIQYGIFSFKITGQSAGNASLNSLPLQNIVLAELWLYQQTFTLTKLLKSGLALSADCQGLKAQT